MVRAMKCPDGCTPEPTGMLQAVREMGEGKIMDIEQAYVCKGCGVTTWVPLPSRLKGIA